MTKYDPGRHRLATIDAPHFCAHLLVDDGRVAEAAPIISWAIGKDEKWLRAYCARKGWRWHD